ncbi:hypothetical protein AgCh_010718 [Apium graveolens]
MNLDSGVKWRDPSSGPTQDLDHIPARIHPRTWIISQPGSNPGPGSSPNQDPAQDQDHPARADPGGPDKPMHTPQPAKERGSRSKNPDDRPKGGFHQDKKFKQNQQSQQTNVMQNTLIFQRLGPKTESKSDPGPTRQAREPRQDPDWTPLNRIREEILKEIKGGSHSHPKSPGSGDEVFSIQPYPEMVISFSSKDYEGVNLNHNEAFVVTLDIFNNEVRRMLIDNGSSVNILFKHTMDRMKLGSVCSNECREDPLYGFGNNLVPIQGTLYLPVIFGSAPNQVTHLIKFYVINTPSSYNGIIGRSALTRIQAITSISHLKIKFSTPTEIEEVKGDYEVAERCYSQTLVMAKTHQDNKRKATILRKQQIIKKHRPHSGDDARKEVQVIKSNMDPKATKTGSQEQESNQVIVEIELNPGLGQGNPTVQATNPEKSEVRENNQQGMTTQCQIYMKKNTEAWIQQLASSQDQAKIEATVETEIILIDESNPSKKVKIGSGLEITFREDLVALLRGFDVNPERKPVKQKRRNLAPERQKAIDEEVEKLLKAGIICEVKYP